MAVSWCFCGVFVVFSMDAPGSQQRMIVALLVIAAAAIGVWLTMEPGRYRALAWVLLGFFAFRVLIGRLKRSEADVAKQG